MRTISSYSIVALALAFLLGAAQPDNTSTSSPVKLAASCDAGIIIDCVHLGAKYYRGSGVKKNRTLANKFFSRACDKQNGEACAILARSYLNGDGVTKNQKIAFVAADRACKLGDIEKSVGLACEVKGKIYSQGLGRAANYEKGFAYHNQSCGLKRMYSCVKVATSLRLGYHSESQGTFPIPKDMARARDLARKACDAKFAYACFEAAQIAGLGSTSYARNMALSCDYGLGNSCFILAKAIDRERVSSNAAVGVKSLEHYRSRACSLDVKSACGWKSRATLARETRERREREAALARKQAEEDRQKRIAAQRRREELARQERARQARWARGECGLLEFRCHAQNRGRGGSSSSPSYSGSSSSSRSSSQSSSNRKQKTRNYSCTLYCSYAKTIMGREGLPPASVSITATSSKVADSLLTRQAKKLCRNIRRDASPTTWNPVQNCR